jgi:hypothetical protein
VTALEAAIVLPIFLILVVFLVEFTVQQVVMRAVDRWALQWTYAACVASDEEREHLGPVIEASFKKIIPAWTYAKGYKICARVGDTLNEIDHSPDPCTKVRDNFGRKGQTVRLEVAIRAGSLTWFGGGRAAGAYRSVVHYYVNEGD